MVRVSRLPGDFALPKLRDTFVHQFVSDQYPHHDVHLHLHYQYHYLRRYNEMNNNDQMKATSAKYQQLTVRELSALLLLANAHVALERCCQELK